MVRDQDLALGGFGDAGPRTIFQIGSVTKVFTAMLLADLAEHHLLTPSDPAASHLPKAAKATKATKATNTTRPVTLAHLATHTSGLSRLPRSLRLYSLASPRDPYAHYPAAQFVRDARRALRTAEPGRYAYSNFGYGVLGYLLAQAATGAYPALVTQRICHPLGLTDTTFEPSAPARLAQGHRRGHPVPPWHMGPLAAAGGLYSTAADLARLLQACLTSACPPAAPVPEPLPEPALAPAIRATLVPRQPIPGGEIGLAWHHARRGNHTIIWHNGMTGGFSSMIAFDPARRLGLAALASSAADVPPLDAAVFAALA